MNILNLCAVGVVGYPALLGCRAAFQMARHRIKCIPAGYRGLEVYTLDNPHRPYYSIWYDKDMNIYRTPLIRTQLIDKYKRHLPAYIKADTTLPNHDAVVKYTATHEISKAFKFNPIINEQGFPQKRLINGDSPFIAVEYELTDKVWYDDASHKVLSTNEVAAILRLTMAQLSPIAWVSAAAAASLLTQLKM